MCVYACAYTHAYQHIYIHVGVYICMYLCMHACVYAHTHTHTHTHCIIMSGTTIIHMATIVTTSIYCTKNAHVYTHARTSLPSICPRD